jgi:hypothetical protein
LNAIDELVLYPLGEFHDPETRTRHEWTESACQLSPASLYTNLHLPAQSIADWSKLRSREVVKFHTVSRIQNLPVGHSGFSNGEQGVRLAEIAETCNLQI